MNKILSMSLGAVLLGAAFMAVQPTYSYAQESPAPVYDPVADRAAESAAQQATRASDLAQQRMLRDLQNARRAVELERFRDAEEDRSSNAAFGRDLGMVLGNFIDREIEGAAADQLRLQEQMDRDANWMDTREQEAQERSAGRDQWSQDRDQASQTRQQGVEGRSQVRDMERQAQTQAREQAQSQQTPQRSVGTSSYRAVQLTTAAKISDAINNFGKNLTRFPSLFYIMSWTAGVFFMAMSLLKANRSINDPSRNPISDAAKYACAGVFLSALPVTTATLQNSLGWRSGDVLSLNYTQGLAGASGANNNAAGLDQFMVNLIKDAGEPMLSIVALFGFVAGVFLLFTGLQRLTKGAQEGPKGPAGLGTIMTFVVGSALLAFVPALKAVLTSVFGTASVVTYPDMTRLATQIGATTAQMGQATAVTTALLAFLAIVGVISFARGLFMLKDSADGAQNASLMGSMSHMIAGVCCVNFGAFANMLQNTLGLTQFGIAFQ